MMMDAMASFIEHLAQQPWGLWWLQARRLVRMEVRRNLFSWKAGWVYFLAFIPTVIIFIHAVFEAHHPSCDERRHRSSGRHRPALLHPARSLLWLPRHFLAPHSRRNDRAQPALLSALSRAARIASAVQVRRRILQRRSAVWKRHRCRFRAHLCRLRRSRKRVCLQWPRPRPVGGLSCRSSFSPALATERSSFC